MQHTATLKKALLVFFALLLIAAVVFLWPRKLTSPITPSATPGTIIKPGGAGAAWRAPVFSPGGDTKVLAWSSSTQPGVFLRYSDGTELMAYAGKLGESFLAWSPDGRYLAVRAEKIPEMTPRTFALVVIDVRNKTTENVTDYLPGLGRPAWKLNGGNRMEVYAPIPGGLVRRVYETPLTGAGPDVRLYEQGGEIWLARDTGPAQRVSHGGGYAPLLSPDGRQILYQWGNDIYLAGTAAAPGQAGTPVVSGISPCWSPDGLSFAFVRETDSGSDESRRSDIWMCNLVTFGGDFVPIQLTNTPREIKVDLVWPEANKLFYAVQNDGSIRSIDIPGRNKDE